MSTTKKAFRRPAFIRGTAAKVAVGEAPAAPRPQAMANLGLRGNQFQRACLISGETYARRGHGQIIEVPVPFRQIGTADHGPHAGKPIIVREQSTIDLMGHLFGVPVAIECKSVNGARLVIETGLGLNRRVFVHEHQLRFLDTFERNAIPRLAASFLLIEFREANQVYALAPADYRTAAKGRKSIPLSEFQAGLGIRVPTMTCGVAVHWAVYVDHLVRKQGGGG
ncbi:MAG TPA: hypothetical protein DCQ64_13815 [Candidatus Rokubacteria bacterium]|nr:hypothetical protein [Candidatus Rokubacteria bacterium]